MISNDAVEAFNTRLTVNVNSIKSMKPSELDKVKAVGSQAEALLKNRELAMFIHQFKFELLDSITSITGHTEEDNSRRVALSNQLSGVDGFIASLQRAVHYKNRAVTQQTEPAHNLKGNEVL